MEKESSVKPQPLVAEILPGFTTLVIVGAAYFSKNPGAFTLLTQSKDLLATVAALGIGGLIASWVIGTFFDSCRDLVEWAVDKWSPLNWEFLFTGPAEDIDRLNDWYLAYYFLNANYVVAIIFVFALRGLGLIALPLWAIGLLVFALLVFVLNAVSLRNEMRDLIGTGLPHEGVYARLKPSVVHSGGVGVFAIVDIKKGTPLFEPDDDEMVWIDSARISGLPKEIRKLYLDFGPLKDGKYGVPTSFNKLTVSWYLNESKTPNVTCDEDFKFRAAADIKAGDELTVDYDQYSGRPPEE
jgi:hypothetical protein